MKAISNGDVEPANGESKRKKGKQDKETKQAKQVPIGFVEIEITSLVKAEWNYKRDDDELKEKLIANLKRNGQVENIVIRELETGCYEIVNGNHRYDAMLEVDFKKVACFNLGTISDATAMRIAVELNETRFKSDHIRLAKVFKEISGEFDITELAATMPFSELQIEKFKKLFEFNFDDLAEGEPSEVPSTEKASLGTTVLKLELTEKIYDKWLEIREAIGEEDTDEAVFEIIIANTIVEIKKETAANAKTDD